MMNTFKFFKYCNNCGKSGHGFYQCKYPITSMGIIVYRYKNLNGIQKQEQNYNSDNIEFLMISRKDSLGLVELIRGKYPLYNKIYLQNIIDVMTNEEKRRILNDDFNTLFQGIWSENNEIIKHKNDNIIAYEKFNKLREGITINNETYNLKSLIDDSSTSWEYSEWGFPKGRRNSNEKELSCALREFCEETGYNESTIKIINNLLPIEEIFIGSNFKSYKHCYYVGFMEKNEEPSEKFQESEVSQIGWFSYKDALNIIRPYNKEKIDVLKKVHTIVSNYYII